MNKRLKVIILIFFLAFLIYLLTPFPARDDLLQVNNIQNFEVSVPNTFEEQPPGLCAGYASAYVLRHYGKKAAGGEIYQELSFKIPLSGYVLPKGIIKYFHNLGFKAKIYQGDLSTLKARLTDDLPIIVLIGDGFNWQHYLTLVGYSDEKKELYFYDSRVKAAENRSTPGNRTIQEDYFGTLWDNGLPVFNHVYIIITN